MLPCSAFMRSLPQVICRISFVFLFWNRLRQIYVPHLSWHPMLGLEKEGWGGGGPPLPWVDDLHHIGSQFHGFTGLACHLMQPSFLQTLSDPFGNALHGRSVPSASLAQAASSSKTHMLPLGWCLQCTASLSLTVHAI